MHKFIFVLILFLRLPVAFAVTPSEMVEVCDERAEMATPFKMCVFAKETERLAVKFDFDKAYRKLREINGWMSEWQPETDLSKVNEAAGVRAVQVKPELFDLLKYTTEISEASGGAFDPTFNAFWGLYNFKKGQEREPSEQEIKDHLPLVNYRNVVLDEKAHTVFLKKVGMKLGLGGIGQGYGVDKVVSELKKHYSAGYVDGSGDTYFWGTKPNGELWLTSVRNPLDKTKDAARIYGTDFAITTAGDDEKFFMVGTRRVHHIIDPKTGRSAAASRQVTVIAPTATEADGYDDAAFILGRGKGEALLRKKGLAAVFIDSKGISITKGLNKKTTPWGDVLVFSPSKK